MYSTRLAHLLMVALSVTNVAQATWLDDQLFGAAHRDIAKRQDDTNSIVPDLLATPSSATDEATSTSTEDSTRTSNTPDTTSTSTSTTDEPTPTPTSSSNNNTPTPTSQSPTSNNGPTSTPPPPTRSSTTSPPPTSSQSNGGNGGDQTSEAPESTPPPSTSTFVTVITTTDASGQTVVTSSSSTIISTPTVAPAESNQPSGMSVQIKNTIIGVCVGVGGAIVLAAAGVLFWRLRSKKRSQEENEELVSYGDGFGGPGTAEKTTEASGSTTGRSPFQSTLESYHAPTQTNAASNF
ncbi:hypothetical protein AAE478_008766 [Parahypoxylon ruwenzoriense]